MSDINYLICNNNKLYENILINSKNNINDFIDKIKKNKYDDNIVINIFVNKSIQSNSYNDILIDKSKYLKQYVRLYFYKYDKINRICDLYIEDEKYFNVLTNIILYTDTTYYSSSIDIINKYISDNKIKNYYIYY